jgi:DNA polymerase I-like protein with 3'-5' exonuclease and polymerase domains
MRLIDEVARLGAGAVVAIDTETTGLRPFNGDVLRGVSVAFRRGDGTLVSEYWPLSHPDSVNVSSAAVARAINQAHRHAELCVYHNGKFDAKFLAQIGVEWPARFYDTKVVSFLLDENENHSLKPTSARLWPDEDAAGEQRHIKELMGSETKGACYKRLRAALVEQGIKEPAVETRARVEAERIVGKTWATLTYDDIAPYAAKDAELTLRLYEWQQSQAEYQRVLPAVEPYLRFEALMHRMECAGVAIDRAYVDQLVAECEDEIEGIRAQFPDVSLDSTPQLQKLIYETWGLTPLGFTGKGAPSTSREALELLEGAHPGLDKILRYRKAKKLVSGFLSQLLKEAGDDGRVHPSFNASSRGKSGNQSESDTVTGRLTCSGPNLQQRPRDLPAGVFVAPEGYELWSYDMSQAELRIAASIAEEPAMIDVFLAGGDIYLATAEELGITRQSSKTVRLSSVYGIGARKLARGLLKGTGKQPTECKFWLTDPEDRYKMKLRKCRKCDSCAARDLLDNYWASVPHLDIVNRNLVAYAEAAREVPLHVEGRYRRYPSPWECAARKLPAPWPRPYTALNSVIQGGCAELLKGWLLAAEPRVNALGARIICTIHDSVTCEVPAGRGLEIGAVLQEALDSVTPEGWVTVPLDPKEGI